MYTRHFKNSGTALFEDISKDSRLTDEGSFEASTTAFASRHARSGDDRDDAFREVLATANVVQFETTARQWRIPSNADGGSSWQPLRQERLMTNAVRAVVTTFARVLKAHTEGVPVLQKQRGRRVFFSSESLCPSNPEVRHAYCSSRRLTVFFLTG